MSTDPVKPPPLTQLLSAAAGGDSKASSQLMEAVYEQLRGLAHRQMANEPAGLTLQPTALVNEAYLRLAGDSTVKWENRKHFFGAAAIAMRRILIERARAVAGPRRGGGRQRVDMSTGPAQVDAAAPRTPDPSGVIDWLALDEALKALEIHDPDLAQIVTLRYFAGLGIETVAQVLGVSDRTVNRDWKIAKAWLYQTMMGKREAVGDGSAP